MANRVRGFDTRANPAFNAYVNVEGVAGVHEMLMKWADPKAIEARNLRATKKAGVMLARILQVKARPLSKRMASSVYVHKMRGLPGAAIVGHHVKKAFFWHMVIGGTKDHSLTPVHSRAKREAEAARVAAGRQIKWAQVRGVRAHPIVEQVSRTYGPQAQEIMIEELLKGV